MTTKNVTALMATISIITVSLIGSAYATNEHTWEWSDSSQEYFCTSSLDTITHTGNVDPCDDLTTSSNVWEGISGSTWSLTETASSGTPVYAWTTLSEGELGRTLVYVDAGDPVSAYIAMNKNESWEDSAQDTGSDGYDWRSLTGHEFGHLAGIKHCTTSCSNTIMQAEWGENEYERSPNTHDDSHMASKY